MRSPRMAPNTFVAPAGKLVQIRPPRALFRFCLLAVDGLMAPARNAVDSETQKEIVLQVGPKNRYFPLSSKRRRGDLHNCCSALVCLWQILLRSALSLMEAT